jgi:hypothetical protein
VSSARRLRSTRERARAGQGERLRLRRASARRTRLLGGFDGRSLRGHEPDQGRTKRDRDLHYDAAATERAVGFRRSATCPPTSHVSGCSSGTRCGRLLVARATAAAPRVVATCASLTERRRCRCRHRVHVQRELRPVAARTTRRSRSPRPKSSAKK